MTRRFAMLFALAALLLLPSAGRAQSASGTPEAVGAEECRTEPISFERLQSIAATPVAETPTPESAASPTPFAMPAGDAADAQTTAAVTRTVREFIACLNAGDVLRTLSLYSDAYIAAAVGPRGMPQDAYAVLGRPTPAAEGDKTDLYDIGDVLILPDGRAAVLVVGDNRSSPDPAKPALFYLTRSGDRWLLDDFVETQPSATPAP
ncbi:MAG: hypothetical protein ACR2OO_14090 [Thermomicrobiales bacterium]